MMSCYSGRVSEGVNRLGCEDGAHTDRGRSSGSEVSLEFPEAGSPSPSSSESDEIDGARKVPLLRGDLKG